MFTLQLSTSRVSHLDAMQGASEKWTELYLTYSEGVSQLATQQRAKSHRCSRLLPVGRVAVRRAG
ncbi:MAG: hypothetical protein AAB541_02275 [Patescibacteria group bacterium]